MVLRASARRQKRGPKGGLSGAGSRRRARGGGLQSADAVGERALAVVRRVPAVAAAFPACAVEVRHARASRLTAFGNRLRQDGFDRRTGAFEHGRQPRDLGGSEWADLTMNMKRIARTRNSSVFDRFATRRSGNELRFCRSGLRHDADEEYVLKI
jgi:hypothetical protein